MDAPLDGATPDDPALAIYPLTPDHWDDLAALFGRTGADGGCWCMFWRLTSTEYNQSTRDRNREALKALAAEGRAPGLLAYRDGEPAGWCGVGPRADFARLQRSRTLGPVDDRPVWSIICFFVGRRHRGAGVAAALLGAAVRRAAEHGAPAIEGYPIDPPAARAPATAAYPGTVAMFRAAGFREVTVTSARGGGGFRSIMRRDLR